MKKNDLDLLISNHSRKRESLSPGIGVFHTPANDQLNFLSDFKNSPPTFFLSS
jgi:hypothetical protein